MAKITFFKRLLWACLGLTIFALGACDKPPAPNPVVPANTPKPLVHPQAVKATDTIWQTAAKQIQLCAEQTRSLRVGVGALLADPNQQTFDDARKAWRRAHQQFQTLTVFFTIADSNPGLFGALTNYRYQLDGQPIQPGFIDYFDVYNHSGIVNDMAITLSAEALRQQHGITDASDISIGFHAMEYLLWGEQGQRPVSDFLSVATVNAEQAELGLRPIDLPNNRRRVYLQLLAELLVDDCAALNQHWSDQNRDLWNIYHQLQADSRLHLWQTAVMEMEEDFGSSEDLGSAEDPGSDSEVEATETDIEEDFEDSLAPIHNQFAQQQPLVLKAKLKGLALLLFGQDSSQTDATTPAVAGLAPWILPGLQPLEATAGATDQADENQALAALKTSFQQLIAALDSDTSWPLSDTSQQSLNNLVDTLSTQLQSPSPSL